MTGIAVPFVLQTSIDVITQETTVEQARKWTQELEALYNKFFSDKVPTWSLNDIHDLDRDALLELEAIMQANDAYPLDVDFITSFQAGWRKSA